MSQHLIRGVSKTLPSVPKTKPTLRAPGREWGTVLRAGSSSTRSTKFESHLSVGFPNLFSFVIKKKGREANE